MTPGESQDRDVRVRAPEPSDAEALAGLLGELGYPSPVDAVARRLGELACSEMDAIFVALLAGEPVGLAAVHVIPLFHQEQPIARITSLVVAERARRRGIGVALLAECEAYARALRADRLELTSSDQRAGAHAFYLSSGFVREAQRFTKRLGPRC